MGSLRRVALACGLLTVVSARANVVGGDLQNFNAVPGGIDFVTVHSSETLEPSYGNFTLMLNHAVNSLPVYSDEGGKQNRMRYNDALTMLDYGLGLGVHERIEIGGAVQQLVYQKTPGGGSHGQFGRKGIINYRAYGKARVLGDEKGGVGVVLTGLFNNVRNNPYVGKGGSPVGIFEIAADKALGPVAAAVNVGYRFRKRGEQIPGYSIPPMGNQYIGSAAMSYLLPSLDTKVIVEIFGSRNAQSDASGTTRRQASSAEVIGGVKYDLTSEIALHAGGGTELINGVSSPDWRAYGGINIAFGPLVRPEPQNPPEPVFKKIAPKIEVAVIRNIQFATGSDEVPKAAIPELENIAKAIKLSPFESISVEGHTDSIGSAESNMALSKRRAETVRKWLIANAGVPEKKITSTGYGESRPIADNGNHQGRQQNRRVEVVIKR